MPRVVPALVLDDIENDSLIAGKYVALRVLGRGGMGIVYEARHAKLGHRVALKILAADLRAYPDLAKRFDREARAAGALSSPHAARVFDIDHTEDGRPFIVMELLDGDDLGRLVERDGPQPIDLAVRWVIEACHAIAEAHRLGIVHRDLKPSNLLLCRDTGSIKVLDFGIAKDAAAGEAAITLDLVPLGTPQYMSPEQVRCAKDVDARTDIWSLGVTLYELLCGRPPFDYDVPLACIAAIVADPIPDPREQRPDIPAELAEVMLRALTKDPVERFQTVDDLVRDLSPFAASAPLRQSGTRTVDRGVDPRRTPGPTFPLVARRGSTDDETLCAARTTAPPSKRRFARSPFAASATVLALVTLMVAPRWSVETPTAPRTAKGAVLEPRVTDLVLASSGEPDVSSVLVDSLPSAEPSRASLARARDLNRSTKPARSSNGGRARTYGADRAVHGGLSSPGF